MKQLTIEDVEVGTQLPALLVKPTTVQLMQYCAATWNTHRIHYDQAYASEEGYPGVLVQSHLHQAFLTRICTDWMGPAGRLKRLANEVRRFAIPGDELRVEGVVTDLNVGDRVAHIELKEVRLSDEVICAHGTAEVQLPRANP
ncbi:MaoC/PaaZ C-terminal domain-containing protein [Brevibacterium luteolum]|uniref:MaoC/PaaZ C-terminal domain-containing protein n=1 Tax=Brevibacterium luteolum TaxID=199591 RepID=UPI00223AA93F|nr:MaoC/PaaZ C-terminal domain-containing protein [Brevibacterium luteolum]MCT1658289.1 acyl dehydratase [Brevibacterium luteolum]